MDKLIEALVFVLPLLLGIGAVGLLMALCWAFKKATGSDCNKLYRPEGQPLDYEEKPVVPPENHNSFWFGKK